jgi:hypothetical protein
MLIRRSKNQNSKIYIPRIITFHPPISYIKEIMRDREKETKRKSKGRLEERKKKVKEKDRFETHFEAQKWI